MQGFVDAGLVVPERGEKNEPRFSFQDLILLKTAQGLAAARIPARRLKQSLARLRADLPPSLPLSGVRITAVGGRIVVQQGSSQWHADSGQYLLAFDAEAGADGVDALPRGPERPASVLDDAAASWLARAAELEAFDAEAAEAAYRSAIACDPDRVAAYVNLGCLLQAHHAPGAAEQVYRLALARFPDEALLHFNLGTALEDEHRPRDASVAYEAALARDAGFADAHYNLARIHEAAGEAQAAIRHFGEYRRLAPGA